MMDRNLFLAILSLDSYNRGYGVWVSGLAETGMIGNATILDISLPDGSIEADFYAIAYKWNGETVVAYRGTDDPIPDILNGYGIGAGNPYFEQGLLAIEFFNSATGRSPEAMINGATNTVITGHSLGGGLAGFVGTLLGEEIVIFDPMPFDLAVQRTYEDALIGGEESVTGEFVPYDGMVLDIHTSFYGGSVLEGYQPWQPHKNVTGGAYIPQHPDDPETNVLDASRIDALQVTATQGLTPLLLPDDTPLSWSLDNKVGQRHAMTLIVIRMFADLLTDNNWSESAHLWMPALFDQELAAAVGADSFTGPNGDAATTMQAAIAYSALSEGDLVFGDAGIRALFDDADNLGDAIGSLPAFLTSETKSNLGELLVEFAGLLAINKIEWATWDEAIQGVLGYSENLSLTIDLTDEKWTLNGALPAAHSIFSSLGLAENILTDSFASAELATDKEFVIDQLKDWLLAPAFDDIDGISFSLSPGLFFKAPHTQEGRRVLLVGTSESDLVELDEEDSPAIVVGGGGAVDIIRGASKGDALIGGDGDDQLIGNAGNDFFFAGIGINTVDGGEGHDTVVFSRNGTTQLYFDSSNPLGDLRLLDSYGDDRLTAIEHVKIESSKIIFNISGIIDDDTNLLIEAAEPEDLGASANQIINGRGLLHGFGVRINDGETDIVFSTENGGTIALSGFNTEIIASDFDDNIFDGSDQEKMLSGGDGDDTLSVAGTAASAVIFGGRGADVITGSDADDFIVDEIDNTGSAAFGSTPAVIAGAGNDTIVLTKSGLADAAHRQAAGFMPRNFLSNSVQPSATSYFTVEAGEGDDRIILDMSTGWATFNYGRGDGNDRVSLNGVSTISYNSSFSGSADSAYGALYQPRLTFNLQEYASSEVSVEFVLTDEKIVAENSSNYYSGTVWEISGTLHLSFADGGSIVVENYKGLWSDSGIDGPSGRPPSDINGSRSFGTTFQHYTSLGLSLSTADGINSVQVAFSLPGTSTSQSAQESLTTRSLASTSLEGLATEDDQDWFLGTGSQSYTGGIGHDRLLVTWDLDALSATFDGTTLTVSDRWGVIGTTAISAIDEVYTVADGASYTAEEFVAMLEERQAFDTQSGTTGNDTLTGTPGKDGLFGLAGDDTLVGLAGNDRLDGGTGIDLMQGGQGDDLYIVDNAGDSVVELIDEGQDTVESSIDYTLPENAENLTLQATSLTAGAVAGTGNESDNAIVGNLLANVLDGQAGNDRLYGGLGDDQIAGGEGNDLLDGGAGADQMSGGAGDDVYYVDSASDVLVENAGEGSDTVVSQIDYALAADFENLILSGAALQGEGNAAANRLQGNAEDNTLIGHGGDDRILGGSGSDTAKYSGASSEYELKLTQTGVTVLDSIGGRDGFDTLQSVEFVYFAGDDVTIAVADLEPEVNFAPELVAPLGSASFNEDSEVVFAIPEGTFSDPDGDQLFYSAQLSDGSPLPDWLTFDGQSLTGIPPQDFNGNLQVRVSASDGEFSASDVLTLSILPVNDAPIVSEELADQLVAAGDQFSWSVPQSTFSDIDGDVLTLTASRADGSDLPHWLTFDGSTFTGTVPAGQSIPESIQVTASDGELTASASFTIAIEGTNQAPVANDDGIFVGTQDQALVILASDLLANDFDADGDALSIVSVTAGASGSIGFDVDGNLVYSADSSFVGSDTFTYTVSDGIETATASVEVRIDSQFAGWSQGTDDDDKLFGNQKETNRLFGAGGDDLVKGGQEEDWLAGGGGDDHLIGLSGDDHFWGNAGNDLINGNGGFDTAYFYGERASYLIETINGEVRIVDQDAMADGDDGTDRISSIELLSFKGGQTASIASPIILDLAGDGVETVSAAQSNAKFDLDGDGLADDTSWIGSGEAFLYLDRDNNGTMSGVEEISFIDDVEGARSDLDGLAAFDSNGDGILDASDERYADFGLWRDADGDGAVDEGETASLASVGIRSINLTGTAVQGTSEFGEVAIVNTGSYTLANGATREFADAALSYFSAATNVPDLAPMNYAFDRKGKNYRLNIAGGAISVAPRRGSLGMDAQAGQLGANTILTFSNRAYGIFAPVVLDIDGDGVELIKRKKTNAAFDYNGDGTRDDTGWLDGDDGFLVIDRNNDGKITEAAELSLAAENEDARSGLQGLASLDSNGDGVVDANDARFGELRVWQDRNENGVTDSGELMTLEAVGIEAIRLSGVSGFEKRVKLDRNTVFATSSFVRSDGTTSTAADVALAYRPSIGTAGPAAFNLSSAGFGAMLGVPHFADPMRTRYELPEREAIFDLLRENREGALRNLFDMGAISPSASPPQTSETLGSATPPTTASAEGGLQTLRGQQYATGALNEAGVHGGEMARKLIMMRQDMGVFGASWAGQMDRSIQPMPDYLQLYA